MPTLFCRVPFPVTLYAFVFISLLIQSSTAQLIETEDEIIPSFYEWMERNSYICESGTQNLPIFLSEAEAEQFNCVALCGEPMETFKACARQPSSSSNSDPVCEAVTEICAREFIQEFLLALGRTRGEEFMQEELDFRSLVQRATSFTKPTTSSTTDSKITTSSTTPSTTTVELSTTTFTPTTTSTSSTTTPSTTAQSTTTTSRQTPTSMSTTSAPTTSESSTVATTSTIASSTTVSSTTSNPTTTISVPTSMTANPPSSSTTTQFSTATSTTNAAQSSHSENKTIQSAVDGDTAPVRELMAIDGDANASVDSAPPARISRLLERFRTAIARTPEPLFETVFRGKLLPPTGNNDKSCPPDGSESCQFWARVGECMQNPRYMLRLCRRACGVCGQVQKQKPQDDIRVT